MKRHFFYFVRVQLFSFYLLNCKVRSSNETQQASGQFKKAVKSLSKSKTNELRTGLHMLIRQTRILFKIIYRM